MAILAQFLLRLAFGLAVGMAVTSPQKVFSGYYRNHLYVSLGLATLATLVLGRIEGESASAVLAAMAAVSSFIGAACWLYEAKRAGVALLWAVALFAVLAALVDGGALEARPSPGHEVAAESRLAKEKPSYAESLSSAAIVSSGLTLGFPLAAMLLGHWYLNAPGMELGPLRRLILAAAVVVVGNMVVVGAGFAGEIGCRPTVPLDWLLFILMRWSFGLVGVLALLWMAWETLKVPNTQSATGILYVAVIGVFVGELTGLLLSAAGSFPL